MEPAWVSILLAAAGVAASIASYRAGKTKIDHEDGEDDGSISAKLEQCIQLIQEVRTAQKEQAAFNTMILERVVRLEVTCEQTRKRKEEKT